MWGISEAQRVFGEVGIMSVGSGQAGVHWVLAPWGQEVELLTPAMLRSTGMARLPCSSVCALPVGPLHSQFPPHPPPRAHLSPCSLPYTAGDRFFFSSFQGINSCFRQPSPDHVAFWNLKNIILGWKTLGLPSWHKNSSCFRGKKEMGKNYIKMMFEDILLQVKRTLKRPNWLSFLKQIITSQLPFWLLCIFSPPDLFKSGMAILMNKSI